MKSNIISNNSNKLLLNVLVLSLFSIIIFASNYGIAFAQETGKVEVLVEGYDGNTIMNVALYNSSLSLYENITINEPTFNFENLPIGDQYLILIEYNGVTYHDQIWINKTSQSLTISVFDITSNDEDLIVQVHHIAVVSGNEYLNITEYLEFTNFGNTVINNSDIKIELPDGYKNFIWNQICCLESTDFGIFFRLIEPLLPNETRSLNFKYRIDPNNNDYSFEKKMYYDTALVILTVNPNELEVISWDNLQSEGLVDVGGEMFDAYSVPSIFKGQRFSIVFTGYKESSDINLLWIGTGIIIVLGAGGVFYAFRRSGTTSINQLKSEEEQLTLELDKIEKDFTNGNIKEVEYLTMKLKNKTALEKVQNGIQKQERVKKNN